MHDGIAIVRKHEYFLKVLTRPNLKLKDVLLAFGGNVLEMRYGVPDCNC